MKNITPTWALAFLSVLGAVLIWSTSFVATKIGLGGFPPFTLAILRLAISTLLLGLAAALTKKLQLPASDDLLKISIGGFVGLTLYFCCENYGIKYTSAGDASILIAAFPILTMLMETAVYKIRLSLTRILGAGVAILGVGLIMKNGAMQSGSSRLVGDLLMIIAGITWATYNFVTRSVISKYPMITVNFYQSLSATLFFFPFAFVEKAQWANPSAPSLYALLYLGIVCSVVAYLLYNFGLRRLDSSSAVSIMNFIPVFGVVFSAVILRESVTLLQIIGGVVILAGVSLSVQRNTEAKNRRVLRAKSAATEAG